MIENAETVRVAIVGGGPAGLACARSLARRGLTPVVFEAADRCGGRCSSRMTPVGGFDDAAQIIDERFRMTDLVPQPHGALPILHPWSVAETPARPDEDDEEAVPALRRVGLVGVPSMRAIADAMTRSIDVRCGATIRDTRRREGRWILHDGRHAIDEHFRALVLALPAPLAAPLAQPSPVVAEALSRVRFSGRWVLLFGSARPVGLPLYREYKGSPIERVAAIHAKPGRISTASPWPQERWFVEADARWSDRHADADADTVAELMLANVQQHAGRQITPTFVAAHLWRHGVVARPAVTSVGADCLWDEEARIGACGDSVVPSALDRVFASAVDLARRVAESLRPLQRRAGAGEEVRAPLLSTFVDREDKRRRMVLLV